MHSLLALRSFMHRSIYRGIVKPICFAQDPELVHERFTRLGKFLGNHRSTKALTRFFFDYQHPMLEQTICGITFRNPVGLAGGFDKNGQLTSIMEDVGFGFVEVGSITAAPCAGNPAPRLKRLPEQKSLWVYYGLCNDGADVIAARLRVTEATRKIPHGINVAKTNCKATVNMQTGLQDYLRSLEVCKEVGDYYVLNISCPNSFGGESFAEPRHYQHLLAAVDKLHLKKPVFVKLSPDLDAEILDTLLLITARHNVQGFICSNLTKKHGLGKGGLSGKAIDELSDRMISYLYKKTKGKYVIIGVGGIFSAADAYRKIRLGASLVQLITGMIYQGPELIGEINAGLVDLLKKDGFRNIHEAIGADHTV